MTVLQATFVAVKTMADGTPRITLDMACTMAELAELGLIPGTPYAIARLTPEAAQQAAQQQTIEQAPAEEHKGGALAKLAGMWCTDPEFQAWIAGRWNYDGVDSEGAAELIRQECRVRSRAELDHDEKAAMRFQELIRLPFMAFKQGRNHG